MERGSACGLFHNDAGGFADIVDLTVGYRHACALSSEGRVACWGTNHYGNLARTGVRSSVAALAIEGLGAVVDVDADGWLTCAVSSERLTCWGDGLAVPQSLALTTPALQVAVLGEQSLSAPATTHACVRYEGGGVACFRLTDQILSDVPVYSAAGLAEIRGSGYLLCSRTFEGAARCDYLKNEYAPITLFEAGAELLDVGSTSFACAKAGDIVRCHARDDQAGAGFATMLSVGFATACASSGNKVSCWGASTTPKELGEHTLLAIGFDIACAAHRGGRVSCWGTSDAYPYAWDPSNDEAPIWVRALDTQAMPSLTPLFTDAPVGACDNRSDLSVLYADPAVLTDAPSRCVGGCVNTLDSASCRQACVPTDAAGLSESCANCFRDFVTCRGTGCFAKRDACIGFPVDFVRITYRGDGCVGENRALDALCSRKRASGEACDTDAECASSNCGRADPYRISFPERRCLAPLASAHVSTACEWSHQLFPSGYTCGVTCMEEPCSEGVCVEGWCHVPCEPTFDGVNSCEAGRCNGVVPSTYYCR